MVLKNILDHAKKHGIHKLRGLYVPTARNKLVEDHYSKLGFAKIRDENGTTIFELSVDSASVADAPVKMRCYCCDARHAAAIGAI